MKRILWLVAFLLLCLFCACAAADTVLYVHAKTSDRVHLRAKASAQSDSLGLYFTGTTAVLESASSSGWTKVSIGTERGYMKSEYLSATPVASMEPTGIVQGGSLNLRPTPSKNSKPLAALSNGETVVVHGETHSGWYYVTAGALDGYVRSEYLRLGSAKSSSSPSGSPYFNTGSDAARYRNVLLSNSPFFNLDKGCAQYAEKVLAESSPGTRFTDFTLVDFDGDGAEEVVARFENDYGALLLKCHANGVYGCTLYYRAFNQLKSDGTFSFSSSAFESGFGHVQLTSDGVKNINLAFSFLDDAGNIGYQVYGRRVDESAFYEAIEAQNRKPDVVWYSFSSLSSVLQ